MNIDDPKYRYERLALVIKALGGGIWDYDIDADCLNCNPRWYTIIGIDQRTSPITTMNAWRPYIHPDDAAAVTEVDIDRVSQWLANDGTYHIDFRVVRPDRQIRSIRSVACLIQDGISRHRSAIGCITDVTDLKNVESNSVAMASAANRPQFGARVAHQQSLTINPWLTDKEKECLMWVSLGKTATETGIILGRSRRTVEFHLNNAVRKLGATNKVHATSIAIRSGLI